MNLEYSPFGVHANNVFPSKSLPETDLYKTFMGINMKTTVL